jgi:hypothetical protein
MHPTIGYRLNQDHLTGLRRHAQRTALARAARAEERTFNHGAAGDRPRAHRGTP